MLVPWPTGAQGLFLWYDSVAWQGGTRDGLWMLHPAGLSAIDFDAALQVFLNYPVSFTRPRMKWSEAGTLWLANVVSGELRGAEFSLPEDLQNGSTIVLALQDALTQTTFTPPSYTMTLPHPALGQYSRNVNDGVWVWDGDVDPDPIFGPFNLGFPGWVENDTGPASGTTVLLRDISATSFIPAGSPTGSERNQEDFWEFSWQPGTREVTSIAQRRNAVRVTWTLITSQPNYTYYSARIRDPNSVISVQNGLGPYIMPGFTDDLAYDWERTFTISSLARDLSVGPSGLRAISVVFYLPTFNRFAQAPTTGFPWPWGAPTQTVHFACHARAITPGVTQSGERWVIYRAGSPIAGPVIDPLLGRLVNTISVAFSGENDAVGLSYAFYTNGDYFLALSSLQYNIMRVLGLPFPAVTGGSRTVFDAMLIQADRTGEVYHCLVAVDPDGDATLPWDIWWLLLQKNGAVIASRFLYTQAEAVFPFPSLSQWPEVFAADPLDLRLAYHHKDTPWVAGDDSSTVSTPVEVDLYEAASLSAATPAETGDDASVRASEFHANEFDTKLLRLWKTIQP